jgi:hypothetical protein
VFTLYGQATVRRYKTFLATWCPAGGAIRVVPVDEPTGWRAYFCAEPSASVADIRADLAVKAGQLRHYEARLRKPFAHEGYLRELADLRDQLKLELSEHPPEGLTPVAELAERIKALLAANIVEATSERAGTRKAARAERPVTARRREWIFEQPVSEAPAKATPEPLEPPAPVVVALPEPVRPAQEFRQNVTRCRQDRAEPSKLL